MTGKKYECYNKCIDQKLSVVKKQYLFYKCKTTKEKTGFLWCKSVVFRNYTAHVNSDRCLNGINGDLICYIIEH